MVRPNLIPGDTYSTVVEKKKVGGALYLGKSKTGRFGYSHSITFRICGHAVLRKFENCFIRGKELIIPIAIEDDLSAEERRSLEHMLGEKGL